MKTAAIKYLGVAFLVAVGFLTGCDKKKMESLEASVTIPEGEKDPAVWGNKYPNHYDSYLRNSEAVKAYGKYRGDRMDRLGPWPFQFVLFDGWGMAVEYNEPNGHTMTMRDQLAVDPSRKKAGGVCLTCKTPFAPELRGKMGADYFKKPYLDVLDEVPKQHRELGVACVDCHEPKTMDLRISRWTLRDALKSLGKDPNKLSRQELRSLVCAQCHVTYSIPKDSDGHSTGLLFPWKFGVWGNTPVEAVIRQIKTDDLREWKHAVTGQKLGHIRHPEFELYASPSNMHWAAGVACADCHMPYERVGSEKVSSHRWESPLKKNMKACTQCHTQSPEWLKERVLAIQDRVNHAFTKAGYAVARAALTIESAASNPKADGTLVKNAKSLYEDAYYRNTFIGAENSMGFHNPVEAMRVLGDALDFARRAEGDAREAILKAGGNAPPLDDAAILKIIARRHASKDGKTGYRSGVPLKAALMAEGK